MKILLADDTAGVRELVEIYLSFENHTVISAQNGLDALIKAKKAVPDFIISDIKMPEYSGPEWIQKYFQDFKGPKPKVLFISSVSNEEIKREYKFSEKYVLLRKPFKYEEFQNAFTAVCREIS